MFKRNRKEFENYKMWFWKLESDKDDTAYNSYYNEFGIRLDRKLVLYLEDLANPKNGLNLVLNPL